MVTGSTWPIMTKQNTTYWFDAFRDAGGSSATEAWYNRTLEKATKYGIPLRRPWWQWERNRDERLPSLIAHHMGQDISLLYSNSGAEAVEAAIKLARRATGRKLIVGYKPDFHGRTLATLALYGDGPAYYHEGFGPYPSQLGWVERYDAHPAGFDYHAHSLGPGNTQLYARLKDVAAVVISPLLGQNTLEDQPAWLWRFAMDVRANGGLVIFDEVQTGFGRGGGLVSICKSTQANCIPPLDPDVWCFGKASGGGFPMSLTVCSPELAAAMGNGTTFNTMAGSPLGAWLSCQYLMSLDSEWLLTAMEQADKLEDDHPYHIIRRGFMFAVKTVNPAIFIDGMKARGVFVAGHPDKPTRITLPFGLSDSDVSALSDAIGEAIRDAEEAGR